MISNINFESMSIYSNILIFWLSGKRFNQNSPQNLQFNVNLKYKSFTLVFIKCVN